MPGRLPHRLAAFCCIGVIAACSLITQSGDREEPALIRFAGEDAKITMPDTVTPGQEFVVKIATWGGGCTRTVSRTVIDGTTIRPYNRTRNGNGVCTADLITIEHQVVAKFDSVGDYSFRIVGANNGYETNSKTVEWVRSSPTVKVRKIPGVFIVPTSAAMRAGQQTEFTATAIPAVSNPRWIWTSSHPVNVSVDSNGVARALLGPRSGIAVCAELVGNSTMRGCVSVLVVPP
jgi:hypothetical protein